MLWTVCRATGENRPRKFISRIEDGELDFRQETQPPILHDFRQYHSHFNQARQKSQNNPKKIAKVMSTFSPGFHTSLGRDILPVSSNLGVSHRGQEIFLSFHQELVYPEQSAPGE